MPEKAIYSLTDAGEQEFEKLMLDISTKPIHIFWILMLSLLIWIVYP